MTILYSNYTYNMFTAVYRPKKLDQFIGNRHVIQPLIRWLLEWDPAKSNQKCALISGFTGIGKSLLVDLLLTKHDCHMIEVALDDDRDKTYMTQVIRPLLRTQKTFDGQVNVLVVSDVDSGCDYGFISSLVDCIKETQIPIICVCNNRYDQTIKPLLLHCADFKLSKPTYSEVYALLYTVVVAERIKVKASVLKDMYEQSSGDIRFLLNALQFGVFNGRKNIQSANVFDTTSVLLSMDETIDRKYDAYWLANDLLPLMVHENYVANVMGMNDPIKRLDNMASASSALSDADLLDAQMDWTLEPYVNISVVRATAVCNKKTMLKFPQYLGRVSAMYKHKREKMCWQDASFFAEKPKPRKTETAKKTSTTVGKEKKPRGRPKKT